MSDFEPYAGIYSGDAIADRTRGEVLELRAEVERLKEAVDMVAEERDAWKARALGLPQEPCRHADHPSAPFDYFDSEAADNA